MMAQKIALISDIHANLEALESVLKEIEKYKPDKIICLGDIVGYGANPRECVELVRKNCDVVLLGNHDEAVFSPEITDAFVEHARYSAEWTRAQLTEQDIEWLKTLPYTYQEGDYFFCHGAPYSPEDYIYLVTKEAGYWSLKFLESIQAKASLSGHAHITYIFGFDLKGNFVVSAPSVIDFSDFQTVAINVGSVGQPRDGNPKSAFGIIEDGRYMALRVQYDIEKASRKIKEAGLPKILYERLFVGR